MQPRASALTGLALAAGLAATLALPGGAAAQQRNCIDTLAGMPDYSRMVNAVTHSHMVNELRTMQNITIFAPTNAAIDHVNPQIVDRLFPRDPSSGGRTADPLLATAAIQAHIVNGRIPAAALAQGVQLTSLAGTQLSIAAPGSGERSPTITAPGGVTARIAQGDIPCTNGVIHGIDAALVR
jgi:uncharacterized surface protein with fasciclin (FAS1) repeats